MKKTDLKPGVEYAYTDDPAGFNKAWKNVQPKKVRLVSVNGSDRRFVRSGYGYGADAMHTESHVGGIEIEDEYTVKGIRYVTDENGVVVRNVPGDPTTNRKEPFEVTYPTRFLKNARGFLMTWDEWLVVKAQREERAEALAKKTREERKARSDAEGAIKNRVDAVLDRFSELGEVTLSYPGYGDKTLPSSFEVGDRIIVGEFEYGDGTDGKVLIGIKINMRLRGIEALIGKES